MAPRLMATLLAGLVVVGGLAAAAPAAAPCDGTPRRGCLLPFPSNVAHTKSDKDAVTHVRVSLRRAEMPANAQGVHIDPREFNRNDGFSPGQTIIAHVPSLRTQADV